LPPALQPTTEQLPAFGKVARPKVQPTKEVTRRIDLPGVPKELSALLFDKLAVDALAPRVYEDSDGSFVLVQLTAKATPNLAEFDKDASRLTAALQAARARTYVLDWLAARCEDLVAKEKVDPMRDILVNYDEKAGKEVSSGYKPCRRFKQQATFEMPAPMGDEPGDEP
jgi:hypothetical protein